MSNLQRAIYAFLALIAIGALCALALLVGAITTIMESI